jgi:hypothetical protein
MLLEVFKAVKIRIACYLKMQAVCISERSHGARPHNPEYHNLNVYHLETLKDHGLRMFEEKMLKKREEVTRVWRKFYNFTVRIFHQMSLG